MEFEPLVHLLRTATRYACCLSSERYFPSGILGSLLSVRCRNLGRQFWRERERKGGIGCVPLVVFVEISTFLGNVEMSV